MSRRRSALRRVGAPRFERNRYRVSPLRCLLDSCAAPPSTIRSASETFVPACLSPAGYFEGRYHLGEFGRLVGPPSRVVAQGESVPVRSAAFVGAAETCRGRPRGGDKLRDGVPPRGSCFESRDVILPDQLVVDRRTGPAQLRLRNPPRPREARETGPMSGPVLLQQLVPSLCQRVCELGRDSLESLRDARRSDRALAPDPS